MITTRLRTGRGVSTTAVVPSGRVSASIALIGSPLFVLFVLHGFSNSLSGTVGRSHPGGGKILGGGSLPLRRLAEVVVRLLVRWRNPLNKHAFSMAITAWSAKVVTSSIVFSVKGSTFSFHKIKTAPHGLPSVDEYRSLTGPTLLGFWVLWAINPRTPCRKMCK